MEEKRVAVVTGASSGIGKGLVDGLLTAGVSVVASSRNTRLVFPTTERLRCIDVDLLRESSARILLDEALNVFGRVDYLFVNAGTIASGTIEEIDIEKMSSMVRLKVESSFRLIYTFLKYFRREDRGHVFVTSSVLGTRTRELSATNVQITCLEPGLVQTNLHRDWPVHPRDLLDIDHPLMPEDIAEAVLDILRRPSHVRVPPSQPAGWTCCS